MLTDWPSLRSLLRRAILTGDVTLSSAGYDDYRTRSPHGLDTDNRLTYCDILYFIHRLPQPEQAMVYGDIGRPCNSSHTSLSRNFRTPTDDTFPRPVGRPRKWASNAERMRYYRAPIAHIVSRDAFMHWHRDHTNPELLAEITDKIVAYVLASSPDSCLT